MRLKPKELDRVAIRCADRHRGTICDGAGGMLPHVATVSLVYKDLVFVEGLTHRPFTLRSTGNYVLRGTRTCNGPYLAAVDP